MSSTYDDEPVTRKGRELDAVGAKTIELYQNQLSLTDRIWSYFSQYSALLLILSCFLGVYRNADVIRSLPLWVRVLPLIPYIILSAGNHRALSLTLDELDIIRGIAVTRTESDFQGVV